MKYYKFITITFLVVFISTFSLAEEEGLFSDSPTRPSPVPPIIPIKYDTMMVEKEGDNTFVVIQEKGIRALDKDGSLINSDRCVLIDYGDDTLRCLVPIDDVIITEYSDAESIEDKEKLTVFQMAYKELHSAKTYDELAEISIRLRDLNFVNLTADDMQVKYFYNIDMTPEYVQHLKVSYGGYLLLEHGMDIKKDDPVIIMIYTLLTKDKQLPFSVGAESDEYGRYSEEVRKMFNLNYGWYMVPRDELTIEKDGQVFIQYPVMGPVCILTKTTNTNNQ